MYKAVHEFPGDAQVVPPVLPIIAQTDPGYLATSAVVEEIAHSFAIPVSSETSERWRRGALFSYHADGLMDDSATTFDKARGAYNRSIELFETGVVNASQKPRFQRLGNFMLASILDMDPEWRTDIHQELRALSDVQPHKFEASTMSEYVKATTEEGRHMGSAVALFMSNEERNHPRFPDFQQSISNLMVLGGLTDNILDLGEDYPAHRTNLAPNLLNRVRLGGAAIAAFGRGARAYPGTVWPVARTLWPAYRNARNELTELNEDLRARYKRDAPDPQ